jgi:hypothetical protein
VILIDIDEEKKGELNGQARLKRSSQSSDRSDDFGTGDSKSDAFWLDDDSGIARSITDPTSMFTPITDVFSDTFKDLLDPTLFRSESPVSELPSSESMNLFQASRRPSLMVTSISISPALSRC